MPYAVLIRLRNRASSRSWAGSSKQRPDLARELPGAKCGRPLRLQELPGAKRDALHGALATVAQAVKKWRRPHRARRHSDGADAARAACAAWRPVIKCVMQSTEEERAAEGIRWALDLFQAALEMLELRLRRQVPARSEDEIQRAIAAWLVHRPGADQGDAEGVLGVWPRQ